MKVINYVSLFAALAALVISTIVFFKKDKVAYVRTEYLFEKFKGTEEAFGKLEKFKENSLTKLDSLDKELTLQIESYKKDSTNYSVQEKLARREKIRSLQYSIYKGKEQLEQQFTENDEKLSAGLMKQVQGFMKEYAEKNGYTVIFGANESGNILYGNDGIDITEELLEKLNKNYQGE